MSPQTKIILLAQQMACARVYWVLQEGHQVCLHDDVCDAHSQTGVEVVMLGARHPLDEHMTKPDGNLI